MTAASAWWRQQHGWRRRWRILLSLRTRPAIHNGASGGHMPRVARTAAGRSFTVLSPNFDTLGFGHMLGKRDQPGALAGGWRPDRQQRIVVIYATTGGFGPLDGPLSRRRVETCGSQPTLRRARGIHRSHQQRSAGNINPNQFPISSVAMDSSDPTGKTAYVTVMGFTGGAGHVWKTTNAGTTWTDFTANLPDAPVNAAVVDPGLSQVYVGTDVGIFGSSTAARPGRNWGPTPAPVRPAFCRTLRSRRWECSPLAGRNCCARPPTDAACGNSTGDRTGFPDLRLESPQTVFVGQTATFNGQPSL